MLPPLINIVLLIFGLMVIRRWPRVAFLAIATSAGSLLFLSLSASGPIIFSAMQVEPPLELASLQPEDHDLIVVIGGGRYSDATEYGADIPNSMGLERLRYAAFLQRHSGLPILVSGGTSSSKYGPEAVFMKRVLEQDFRASVQWSEMRSRTTWENASFSRRILQQSNKLKILLVTHSWHMPRAVYSFRQAGFSVTPAPTIFSAIRSSEPELGDFIPTVTAFYRNSLLLHEIIGLFWYRLAGGAGTF